MGPKSQLNIVDPERVKGLSGKQWITSDKVTDIVTKLSLGEALVLEVVNQGSEK